MCLNHRHACGLKLEGPPKSRDPRSSGHDFILFRSLQVKASQAQVFNQQASFFQAHPPLPGLPAGLKAWPIMGVLVVWVRVCAVYWRNKAGGIAVRRRRRSSEAGKDGLGVAGSGSDAVGGTTGRLRSVCVPQRSSLPLAVNAITTVYFYIFPLGLDQPMTPDGTLSLPTTSLFIGTFYLFLRAS